MAPILFFQSERGKQMAKENKKFEVTIVWHPCDPKDPNTWPEKADKYLISTKNRKVLPKYFGQARYVGEQYGYNTISGRDAGWPEDVKKIITAWAEYPDAYVDPVAEKREAQEKLDKLKKELEEIEAKKAELESIING